jgi:Carboxypeptidase regulatory-like domain
MASQSKRIAILAALAAIAATLLVAVLWRDDGPSPTEVMHTPTPDAPSTVVETGVVHEEAPPIRVAVISSPVRPRALQTTVEILLRSEDGPIAGSRVELHARGRVFVAKTGARGTANWIEVPAGAAVVRSARGCEKRAWIEEHTKNRIELIVPHGVEVHGRAIDDVGQAVPNATIYLARPVSVLQKLDPIAVATADSDGRFQVLAVPDHAKIGARAPGHQPSTLHPILHRRLRGKPHELTIVIPRGGCDLRGSVNDRHGEPVRQAEIELNGGIARIAPTRGGKSRSYTWPTHRTRTDADGKFLVAGHRPGTFDLLVRSPGHAPWNQRIVLAAGADKEVRVTLDPGSSLRGKITTPSGSPIVGARVDRVGRDGAWFRGGVSAMTDRHGNYSFTGLAAGDLNIFVRKEGYADLTKRVAVPAGEPGRLDVVLTEHPRARGRVIRPDGSPCAGVLVSGRAIGSGRPSGKFAKTDSTGGFELSCPTGSSWTLHLTWSKRGIEIDAGVAPIRGARSDIVIVLDETRDATAGLRGKIVGLDGKPMLGAWLQLRTKGVVGHRQQLRTAGHANMVDGSFSVGPLPPGRYWLRAHPQDASSAPTEFGPFQLAPRARLDLGTLQQQGGVLHIRTTFADGDLPSDAIIASIYDAKTDLTVKTFGLDSRTPTDIALPPGRYYLGCFVKGYLMFRSRTFHLVVGTSIDIEAAFRRDPRRR